jgi:GAF domain-containing protein
MARRGRDAVSEVFRAAMRELATFDGVEQELTLPVLRAVPVSGASVSTLGGVLAQETVAFSDAQAARVDELQFDLGEGPCWDVVATGKPVLEPDVQRHPRSVWPAFSEGLRDEQVGALFAFPLTVGTLRLGALDLYHARPSSLSAQHALQAGALAEALGRYVLRRAMRTSGDADLGTASPHSRRIVHQATGFVIAQLGLSAEDAQLLIQGQALAQSRPVADIAEDIVSRRLSFARDGDERIERRNDHLDRSDRSDRSDDGIEEAR